VHQVRGLVDDAELAVVIGDGDVDAAQVARRVGVGGDLEVRVAGVGQQLGEDVVASTSATPSSSGPVPSWSWLSTAARLARLAA